MTGASSFLDRFEQIVGASGWRVVASPAQLIEQWREFVAVCGDGYSSTIYEFENERSVRDLLERALTDPALGGFPELDAMRSSIEGIDDDYRRACRADVQVGEESWPWWRRCVPQRAIGEFAEDVKARWGLDPA